MLWSRMQLVTSRPPLPAPPLLPQMWLNIGIGVVALAAVVTVGFMIRCRRRSDAKGVTLLNVVLMGLLALIWVEQFLQKPDLFSRFHDRDTWLHIVVGLGIALALVAGIVELIRARDRTGLTRKQKMGAMSLVVLGFAGVLGLIWMPGLSPHVGPGHELGLDVAVSVLLVGMTVFLALALFWVRGVPQRQKAARVLLVVLLVVPWVAMLI